jgi:hypothetical protein
MSEVGTDYVRQPPAGDTTDEIGHFLGSADDLPAPELRDGLLLASIVRIPLDNTDGGGNACNQRCVSLMNIDCNPAPTAPVKLIPVGTEELLPCNHSRKHIATMSFAELWMHANDFLAELSRRGLPRPVYTQTATRSAGNHALAGATATAMVSLAARASLPRPAKQGAH